MAHDHETEMNKLTLLTAVLDGMPLDEMRAAVESADSIGFVVDPTKYRDALHDGRLRYQRELVDAAIVMRGIRERAIEAATTGAPFA